MPFMSSPPPAAKGSVIIRIQLKLQGLVEIRKCELFVKIFLIHDSFCEKKCTCFSRFQNNFLHFYYTTEKPQFQQFQWIELYYSVREHTLSRDVQYALSSNMYNDSIPKKRQVQENIRAAPITRRLLYLWCS